MAQQQPSADRGALGGHRQYRKKPVVIEARQLGTDYDEDLAIMRWCHGEPCAADEGLALFTIRTLEGPLVAREGDWIIRGVHGGFHPCNPDIFAATYEPVAADPLGAAAGRLLESDVVLAEQIARRVHAGQKEDSTGDDYIHHVERVVTLVNDAQAKVIAWLHDVVEDTKVTHEMLEALGFDARTLAAVWLLTRESPYDYEQYISEIKNSGNEFAIAVKIADLRDHLRPNCPPSLRPRYERALRTLTGSSPAGGRGAAP